MNRSRLLLIGLVALALGAFVSMSVYRNLQSYTHDPQPGADILVAANDLPVGVKIEDKDIKVVRFPAADLPEGVYHLKTSVIGRGVVTPIARGDFFLPEKLAGENAGSGLPSLIPPGMRAVAVRVNEVIGVSGFAVPGTRVDVLLTGEATSGGLQQTTTVLENVLVIASGQKLEKSSSGLPQNAPVITLLVSPDDAQKLTLAQSEGKIQLALRSPLDTKQQDLNSTRSDTLYRSGGTPAPAAPKIKAKKTAAPVPVTAPSGYSVQVIRGDKETTEKFDDNNNDNPK